MDTDAPGSPGPELREYTALLGRRWRLVCAGVLGGLVLTTAGVFVLPPTYVSTTVVQVRPTGMAEFTGERAGRLTGDVNLDTEAQIILSDQVSATVAETLAETTPEPLTTTEMRERVALTVPPNSNVLEIEYSAGTPEAARTGADAYAGAYLDQREEQVDDMISGQLEALRAEQDARYEALSELSGASTDSAGTTDVSADAQAEALRAEITELGNGISPLSALQETVEPGRVLTPADLPERASAPMPTLWLTAGAALGLVAGLLMAVVRDRLDPRLRDTEGTARAGAVPVLLDLSSEGRRAQGTRGTRAAHAALRLLADDSRGGQRVNELAHLVRAHLAAPGPADGDPEVPAPGSVVLTAATVPGRAGAAVAVNLAASLARTGSETLLVCADPRAAAVGELLELSEGPGLAEALVEGADPAELAVRPSAVPRLRVLRHGAADLVAPVQDAAMPELLRLLRADAEFVVVVVAPRSERADAHALAADADLLLPVVELGRTRRADLTGLIATAARFGPTVPGVAVLPRLPLPDPAPASTGEPGGDVSEAASEEAPEEVSEEVSGTDTEDDDGRADPAGTSAEAAGARN